MIACRSIAGIVSVIMEDDGLGRVDAGPLRVKARIAGLTGEAVEGAEDIMMESKSALG